MPRTIRRLGWKPNFPDHRDQFFTVGGRVLQALPPSFDLTQADPRINFPIYDQGQIGSCTANALAAAVEYDRIKSAQAPDFVPSRLFLYYAERKLEGSIASDSGAYIRDGVKALNQTGICLEADWPYDDTPAITDGGPFPVGSKPATQPSQQAYNDAADSTITSYQALQQTLSQLQETLVSGFPFVFGFTVYKSWISTESTIVPLPANVGYDNATRLFKFRNSWGPDAGEGGYFSIPYSYVTDPSLAQDFWVINAVSD